MAIGLTAPSIRNAASGSIARSSSLIRTAWPSPSAKRGTYAGLIEKIPYLHTTEGGQDGPTLCYRGLANDFYYILESDRSCQDGDISWFDWRLLEKHAGIHRFVWDLIALRQRRDLVANVDRLSLNQLLARATIEWHGVALHRPDWGEHSHSLAFTLRSLQARYLLHGMLNAYWEPLRFELPPVPGESQQRWRRCIDTALASPDDISRWERAAPVTQPAYVVQPRSVVFLVLGLQGRRRRDDRFRRLPVDRRRARRIRGELSWTSSYRTKSQDRTQPGRPWRRASSI
jgi:pullulanase/glycogen debranching enzyme